MKTTEGSYYLMLRIFIFSIRDAGADEIQDAMEQDAFDVADLDLDDVDDGPDDGDDEFDDAVLDEFDQNVIGAAMDQNTYEHEGKGFVGNPEN